MGSDYAIPGLYTQTGYQQFFWSPRASAWCRESSRTTGYWGAKATSSATRTLRRLMVELEQLYFRDYANYWGEAVAQLGLEPLGNTAEGITTLPP